MPPRLNEKRAQFVLAKIDQILVWERATDRERDTRFVELGRYLSGAGKSSPNLRTIWRDAFPNREEKPIT
jgi:hypothetical protein